MNYKLSERLNTDWLDIAVFFNGLVLTEGAGRSNIGYSENSINILGRFLCLKNVSLILNNALPVDITVKIQAKIIQNPEALGIALVSLLENDNISVENIRFTPNLEVFISCGISTLKAELQLMRILSEIAGWRDVTIIGASQAGKNIVLNFEEDCQSGNG